MNPIIHLLIIRQNIIKKIKNRNINIKKLIKIKLLSIVSWNKIILKYIINLTEKKIIYLFMD